MVNSPFLIINIFVGYYLLSRRIGELIYQDKQTQAANNYSNLFDHIYISGIFLFHPLFKKAWLQLSGNSRTRDNADNGQVNKIAEQDSPKSQLPQVSYIKTE
jgi:hypothetical protein